MSVTLSPTDARPGADLVRRGLEDVRAGRCSVEACLVSFARSRLELLGFEVAEPVPSPELTLYSILQGTHGDGAHSQYNALRRRLLSFLQASR